MGFKFESLDLMGSLGDAIHRWEQERKEPFSLGVPSLEYFINIVPGDSQYIVIGAQPGTGKTALALQIATAMAKKSKVAYYTFEVPANQLQDRVASNISGIDIRRFKRDREHFTADESNRVAEAMYAKFGRDTIQFKEAGGASIEDVIRDADANGYEVVIIDHLGCVRTAATYSRADEVRIISGRLRDWRQSKQNLIIIALTQLPKSAYNLDAKSISAIGAKDSSSVTEDADTVVYLHRDMLGETLEDRSLIDMVVSKNRSGSVGSDYFKFDGLHQRFVELTDTERSDLRARLKERNQQS